MYTYVNDDVEVVDWDGLKKYVEDFKAGKFPEYKENMYLLDGIELNEEDKRISFNGMDGWKIISYWYDHFVLFLRDLAVFLEGDIYLDFENEDEGGNIRFSDGEVIITTGVMEWKTHKTEEFVNKNVWVPLRDELKQRLLIRNI